MTDRLVPTEDGSCTLHDPETGELYHNRAGAYTEALKHYVQGGNCLQSMREKRHLRVLDVCYGMGYNTWVLLAEILKAGLEDFTLSVIAIERDPEVLHFLPEVLKDPRFDILKSKTPTLEHNTYYRTLGCLFNTKGGEDLSKHIAIDVVANSYFELSIILEDVREELPRLEPSFDFIFHDSFSPARVPELWTVDLFRHYYRLLSPANGRLLTYSTAAAVRGGLQEAGFHVYRTDALGKKQGGTVATIAAVTEFEPLYTEELAYLQTRAGIPYRDPGLSCQRREIIEARLQEQSQSERSSGKSIKTGLNQTLH